MPKANKFWNVKRSSDSKSVDIYIYGIIGESWLSDGTETVASQFVPEFKALEQEYDRINVRINSPGGSVWDGLPVFNVISQSEKDVHTYNDGIAYSMAAIILMAGKQIHAAKNSLMLLHSPLTIAIGNALDMRNAAEKLDKCAKSLMTSVADKTGLTMEEVEKAYFDYNDHLLTADEAMEGKLIDEIVGKEAELPEGISNMSYKQVMNLFEDHNPYEKSFMNALVSQLKNVFNISPKQKTEIDIIMENIEKFQNILSLEPSATVEDVLSAIGTLMAAKKQSEDDSATLTQDKQYLNARLEQLEGELADVTAKFEELKNQDGGDQTGAVKDKDKIEGAKDTPADKYAHNQEADRFIGKK